MMKFISSEANVCFLEYLKPSQDLKYNIIVKSVLQCRDMGICVKH